MCIAYVFFRRVYNLSGVQVISYIDVDLSNDLAEPYGDMPWLKSLVKMIRVTSVTYLRDLHDSLKKVIHDQQRLGQTN